VNTEVHGLGDVSPAWLANELDDHGVVRLGEVFSDDWLDAMRTLVAAYIAANGNDDFYVDHADHEIGSPTHQLVSDPAVRRLLTETTGYRRPRTDSTDDAMRCSMLVRAGTARKAPSHLFHYDPCVLTMVVPIFIPQGALGTCGELAVLRNKRPFRRFHARHLIDTVLTHNSLYRRHVTKRIHGAPEKYVVELRPGDAYLFWGYRTFHGNLSCAPGQLRTTLVLKFGAVHSASSWTSKAAWRLSRSRRDLGRFQYLPPLPTGSEPSRTTSESHSIDA
jgi:hypothetical protein